MQSFPTLSLGQLLVWLREVLASPTLSGTARLLAAALATYHNSETGWTFPSLRTLARDMHCTPKTVIRAYRELEADRRLQHLERRSGPGTRDRMSHQYVLLPRGDLAENRAARKSARGGSDQGGLWQPVPQPCTRHIHTPVGLRETNRPSLIDQPERPETAAAQTSTPKARESHEETKAQQAAETGTPEEAKTQAAQQPTPEHTGKREAENADKPEAAQAAPLPCSENRCVRLARRIQRLADGRGWRLENARKAVEKALRRAGTEAVERLICKLEEGDCRPAYELQGMLDGLRKDEATRRDTGISPGPFDAAYQHAKALYHSCRAGGGVVDFSRWKRIEERLNAADITGPFRWNNRPGMIAAMAQAIRAGTLAPEAV
jgi:hypothetical protein